MVPGVDISRIAEELERRDSVTVQGLTMRK
jgi:hypothetical protein